jgi:hypothetical protein
MGYCHVCERFWTLPSGGSCPKHETALEPAESLLPTESAIARTRWVTVGRFTDALRAEPPRIRLEAEGIPTFIEGERMGSHSMYHVATGGVKLQVPDTLVADARVLLAQSWSPPQPDDDLEDAWDDLGPEPGALRRTVMRGVILVILFGPLFLYLFARLLGV